MTFEIIFLVSGALLAVLILAKVRELHREKPLLLKLISRGDEHVRIALHHSAHFYADARGKAELFVWKQLPLKLKTWSGKAEAFIQDETEKLVGNIRGSRFLKKSDGLSEFFKSLDDRENGEIHDRLDDVQDSEGR